MENKEKTESKITSMLDELGTTAEEVRSSLKALNISGIPKTPCHCPIANFLKLKVAISSSVGRYEVLLISELESYSVPLPQPVQSFISKFDSGILTMESCNA